MSLSVGSRLGPYSVETTPGALLLGWRHGRTYDVTPDGKRFLTIKAPGTDATGTPPALIVMQHWDEDLKRIAPTK